MGLSAKEQQEIREYLSAKREEARRGLVDKRATELGDELLRPIGVRMNSPHQNGLTTASRADMQTHLHRVIQDGKDNELFERQKGWQKK